MEGAQDIARVSRQSVAIRVRGGIGAIGGAVQTRRASMLVMEAIVGQERDGDRRRALRLVQAGQQGLGAVGVPLQGRVGGG